MRVKESCGHYEGGSNVRPAAHDAAGQKIARDIVPLAADGNPDPVNGKIVIMPVKNLVLFLARWPRAERFNKPAEVPRFAVNLHAKQHDQFSLFYTSRGCAGPGTARPQESHRDISCHRM